MDDKKGLIILAITVAILGILKLVPEIIKLILELLEETKSPPRTPQLIERKRKG